MDETLRNLMSQVAPLLVQLTERAYGLSQKVDASQGDRRALERVGMRAHDLLSAFAHMQSLQ